MHGMFNAANKLTLFRILVIPAMVMVYYSPFSWRFFAAGLLFSLAAITDFLDGYVARKYDQATPFGAFLDPVADKLIVAAALCVLIQAHNSLWFTVPAIVIVGREIVISALREWMAELGVRSTVAVSAIGKVKTTFQMIAIIVLLVFPPDWDYKLTVVGFIALYIAAGLTLYSMIIYLKAAWPELLPEPNPKVVERVPEAKTLAKKPE